MGQASPQPMVTTTSAACTISSVQGLGYSLVMSMPTSAMACDGGGVDFVAGFGAARPRDRAVAGEVGEESERHLGAAGVVGAQEQHGGFAVVVLAFDPGQRVEPLAGEPFGQQRQEVGHGRAAGELVVGRVQEPFDGLDAEHAVELALQSGRGGLECELLVDGQVAAQMVGDWAVGHFELLWSSST